MAQPRWQNVAFTGGNAGSAAMNNGSRVFMQALGNMQNSLDAHEKRLLEQGQRDSDANTGAILDKLYAGKEVTPEEMSKYKLYDSLKIAEGRKDMKAYNEKMALENAKLSETRKRTNAMSRQYETPEQRLERELLVQGMRNRGRSGSGSKGSKGSSGKGFSGMDLLTNWLKDAGQEDTMDAGNMLKAARNLDEMATDKNHASAILSSNMNDNGFWGWGPSPWDEMTYANVTAEDATSMLLNQANKSQARKEAYKGI